MDEIGRYRDAGLFKNLDEFMVAAGDFIRGGFLGYLFRPKVHKPFPIICRATAKPRNPLTAAAVIDQRGG
jgi:hypothetical protein